MELSNKLKQCRADLHLTQLDVAHQLHVSRKTISGWENGHSIPDIQILVQLSNLYQVSLDDLLKDDRVISHYEQQTKRGAKQEIYFIRTTYLNLFLLVAGYINLFHPLGFHTGLIPLALMINLALLSSWYPRWDKFNNKRYLTGVLLFFAIVFAITLLFSTLDPEYLNQAVAYHHHNLTSFYIAKLLHIAALSWSVVVAVWFHRRKID